MGKLSSSARLPNGDCADLTSSGPPVHWTSTVTTKVREMCIDRTAGEGGGDGMTHGSTKSLVRPQQYNNTVTGSAIFLFGRNK